MTSREPIVLHEHKSIVKDSADIKEYLEKHNVRLEGMPDEYMGTPKYLGIDETLTASYFIGASWLVENKLSVVVLPKIENIDFLDMFMTALSVDTNNEKNYFSKCYGIDFNAPPIETKEDISQLTPLLLVHFLKLLDVLVSKGLKKDYVTITENLKNKIKGHIVLSQQIKKNIIPKRVNRNVCTYQIYTEDIPVNRLLKKALIFANNMLLRLLPSNKNTTKLKALVNNIMPYFNDVSDVIQISEVKQCYGNKLFKSYVETVKVAKDILRRFDYSLTNIGAENRNTPCFWIDMSRLFELYVYSRLSEIYGENIKFQVSGYQRTAADYIHVGEHIIMDAKYKQRYDRSFSGILPDIREMSGYARDYKILKHFGNDFLKSNDEVKCLIIYPQDAYRDAMEGTVDGGTEEEFLDMTNMSELTYGTSLWSQGTDVRYFRNFRKLKVSLPIINK